MILAMMYLPAFQTFSFYVGPGSASVCAGGARGNLQDEFSQESLFGSGSA